MVKTGGPLRRKLWRMLRRQFAQALALGLVVATGISLFVGMAGALVSLRTSREAFYREARFADLFASVVRMPRRHLAELARLPGVRRVEGRVVGSGTLLLEGFPEPITARFLSLPEHGLPALNRPLVGRGRMPAAVGEVLVNEAFARAHDLAPGARLDARIGGLRRTLVVAGIALSPEFVYAVPPGSTLPDDLRFAVVWARLPLLERAFDLRDAVNDLAFDLEPDARPERVAAMADRLLAPWGGLGAHARDRQPSHFFLDNEIRQLRNFAALLPTVFLAVAAFLLHAVLRRAVEAERAVIGVLRALGLARTTVAAHYLAFALLLAIPGILLGLAAGWWLAAALTRLYVDYFHLPRLVLVHDPLAPFAAIAAGLLAATAGGGGAALAAARLDPARALQVVPGVPGRPPLAGRLAPWLFDVLARAALRHLARHPLRTLAAAFGIAAGFALFHTALAWLDAVEVLLREQFGRIQREDLSVRFERAVDAEVVSSLRALPGVLRVEPLVETPVVVHGPAGSRRTVLIGLDPGARLRRLQDRRGRAVEVAGEGIFPARALARRIGLRPGSRAELELIEAGGRRVRLPVFALPDSWLGIPVYAERRLVARLARREGGITGALLEVDPARLDELARRVAGLREVAAVQARRDLIAVFHRTLAESLDAVLLVYLAFAGAVVFGVSAVAGRVLLAERLRTLATLRVLGYGPLEVAHLFGIEMLAVVLLALPLGALSGHLLVVATGALVESELYRIPTPLSPRAMAAAALVCLTAALLAGIHLARGIARLDPAAALRTPE